MKSFNNTWFKITLTITKQTKADMNIRKINMMWIYLFISEEAVHSWSFNLKIFFFFLGEFCLISLLNWLTHGFHMFFFPFFLYISTSMIFFPMSYRHSSQLHNSCQFLFGLSVLRVILNNFLKFKDTIKIFKSARVFLTQCPMFRSIIIF